MVIASNNQSFYVSKKPDGKLWVNAKPILIWIYNSLIAENNDTISWKNKLNFRKNVT